MSVILSGLLHALLFPKFSLVFLFPFFLIPLLLYILRCEKKFTARDAFFKSWLAGSLSNLIILYWIYGVLYLNGAGAPGALAGLIALAAYTGLYWGVFGSAVNIFSGSKTLFLLLFIPAAWTALEYLRTYLLSGFPWLLTGYSLWRFPTMIGAADITGVYGISFYVVFVNAAIALALKRRKAAPAVSAVLFTAFLLLYGNLSEKPETSGEESRRVSLLQGNISQYMKWDSEYERNISDTYQRLSMEAAAESPDIIIWPETALPGVLTREPGMTGYMRGITRESGAYALVGSVEQRRGKYYNSAYVISPGGALSAPYRKMHLTPFGEYIPMRGIMSLFIGVINEIGDFDPGSEAVLLDAAGISAAVGICFESIFPNEARRLFLGGAELYVNITNDGWFLDTAGPYQHFVHSVFRAVENRSYAVRAANTGISAVISPDGRIIKQSGLMEEAVITGDISPKRGMTFYSRYGDVFAIACLFAAAAAVLWRIRNVSGFKRKNQGICV